MACNQNNGNSTREYCSSTKNYENNEVQVKVGNTVSTSCITTKGLKQEHILSPTLFKIYLESVL